MFWVPGGRKKPSVAVASDTKPQHAQHLINGGIKIKKIWQVFRENKRGRGERVRRGDAAGSQRRSVWVGYCRKTIGASMIFYRKKRVKRGVDGDEALKGSTKKKKKGGQDPRRKKKA